MSNTLLLCKTGFIVYNKMNVLPTMPDVRNLILVHKGSSNLANSVVAGIDLALRVPRFAVGLNPRPTRRPTGRQHAKDRKGSLDTRSMMHKAMAAARKCSLAVETLTWSHPRHHSIPRHCRLTEPPT
jgi:hypothetical protein